MNLNQVTIPSSNVPKSIEFYKKLGLHLIVHTHNHYARFECPVGGSTFSLHYAEELPSRNGTMVYFEVEDVNKEVGALKKKGIHFQTEVVEQSWLWTEAKLLDPDGNQIIIYNAGVNRKNPPWRISEA